MNNEETKTVVVLGMHRSGTSMTAGILSILGVNMGAEGRPADSNVRGHFEDHDFLFLNKKILAFHKASWDDPPSDTLTLDPDLKNRAKKLLLIKANGIWGWKDPRTVFTIEYYLAHLPNPYFIFVDRDTNEVARSLQRRNSFPIEKGAALSKKYKRKLDTLTETTQHLPQLFLSMNSIIASPTEEARTIARFLEIPLNRKQEKEVRSFVLPTKKRRLMQISRRSLKKIRHIIGLLLPAFLKARIKKILG